MKFQRVERKIVIAVSVLFFLVAVGLIFFFALRNTEEEAPTVYTYGDASKAQLHVLVEVKQSAMDGALMQWLTRPAAEKIRGFNDVPALPLSKGNGKTKILILGNSFVNPSTSAIAEILKEMIDAGEKECTVHRFSLG
jgi:hypothetical protein